MWASWIESIGGIGDSDPIPWIEALRMAPLGGVVAVPAQKVLVGDRWFGEV